VARNAHSAGSALTAAPLAIGNRLARRSCGLGTLRRSYGFWSQRGGRAPLQSPRSDRQRLGAARAQPWRLPLGGGRINTAEVWPPASLVCSLHAKQFGRYRE